MIKVFFFLLGALGLLALYVRVAPSDPARWHVEVHGETATFEGGTLRVLAGRASSLATLSEIITAEPRTRLLAGSVEEGRITFVTRSKLWGFPDYATVEARGDDLVIWSRLRFGKSDLGVNSARVTRWIAALGQ